MLTLETFMGEPPQKTRTAATLDFNQLDPTLKRILLSRRGTDLSVRVGNICAQAGLDLLGDVIQIPEGEWFRFRGCGRKTVEELRAWVEGFGFVLGTTIHNWPSKRELDVLRAQQMAEAKDTRHVPTPRIDFCRLDEKSRAVLLTELDDLGLSVRARNICVGHELQFAGDIVQIPEADWNAFYTCGRKTVEELKSWAAGHGLILGTVIENWPSRTELNPSVDGRAVAAKSTPLNVIDFRSIDATIRAWLIAPLSELNFSVRAQNIFKALGLNTVGDLVTCSESDLRSAGNCGQRTLREIHNFLKPRRLSLGATIENRSSRIPSGDPRAAIAIENQKRFGPLLDAAKVVEEELISLAAFETSDRNVKLVTRLWGWFGKAPCTLEAVGVEFGVTRERVRQVAANVSRRISKRKLAAPLVLAAARFIHRSCPATADHLAGELKRAGLSRVGVHPLGIEIACKMLGIPLELERASFGKITTYSLEEQSPPFMAFEKEAWRRTQSSGCVNFEALCDEVGVSASLRGKIRDLMSQTSQFGWLNEEKTWFYSRRVPVQRNRLLNLASKVLAVCPKIQAGELRTAVARSRRLEVQPPVKVLERLVVVSGLARSEGDCLIANSNAVQGPEPGSTEDTFVRVLRQHGPALSSQEFEERCIEAGINPITFYIYRSGSPVVTQLAPGVYSPVGALVPPGLINELASKSRRSRLVEYGWDKEGHIWCAVSLSRPVITTGSLALPSFVANLVQGEWTIVLPDRSRPGQARAKDTFLSRTRKALAYLGAEPGDFVLFEFDRQSRVLRLRIGGRELIEAAQTGELDQLIDD
jgi:DNA-directed RNA polymerase subunit alpha